jgi:hypothetical protein
MDERRGAFPLGRGHHDQGQRSGPPPCAGVRGERDANVSFDGKSILFAGKKNASDHWQIWEMPLSGGGLRQLTAGSDDAIRPMYLPEGRIVYAQKQNGRYAIETLQLAKKQILSLTYMPGDAVPTDVLRDGRVLFEAGYPLGSGDRPELYTVYSDGSGVEAYRCDHGSGRYSGKQVSSGDIVFTHGQKLSRFTSPLAHEVEVAAPAGEYDGDIGPQKANALQGEGGMAASVDRLEDVPVRPSMARRPSNCPPKI